jgi:hypothetical protein|tara:strand:+ start:148 stop:339 length:192 start_codon:yes stop_codon:yes gene_type:complete
MERIFFTIPFGDTADPEKVAGKIAKDLQFRSWHVKITDSANDDDDIAATRFVVIGWTTKWQVE